MPDQILVTGGAGFVGSAIALQLKHKYPQADVVACDNLRRRGSQLNIARLNAEGVRFQHGDVRQPADLLGFAPDLIVECSAEPSAQAGYGSEPDYAVETNLFGCYHCLNLARRTRADFIFLSTSRVYPVATLNGLHFEESDTRFEWADEQPVEGASAFGISEAFPTAGVRSIYGMTKLAAELMIQEYAEAYGFRYATNRCGLIAGPWQMGKADQGILTFWLASHYFGKPLRFIGFGGEGKQVRDVLHVDDVADLVALQAGSMDRFHGQTLNIGGGTEFSLSLRELTAASAELTGRRLDVGSDKNQRQADLRIYLTDSRKVASLHGWKPQRSPQVVLKDTLAWIRTHEREVGKALFAG